MWMTDSLWFEVAVVNIIFAVGNILFGHFEVHTSKIKRIGKYIITLFLILSISIYFGRTYSMIVLGTMLLAPLYIHLIYLPGKGINGWTAEPKDKYYELRGWNKKK